MFSVYCVVKCWHMTQVFVFHLAHYSAEYEQTVQPAIQSQAIGK